MVRDGWVRGGERGWRGGWMRGGERAWKGGWIGGWLREGAVWMRWVDVGWLAG